MTIPSIMDVGGCGKTLPGIAALQDAAKAA